MAEVLNGIVNSIISVFAATWWIVLPLALAFIFWKFWLYYIIVKYLKSIKWLLLEIKIPPNIEKTPKAMEQVFSAIYGIYSFGFTTRQKYIEGHLREDWVSFELVGFAGGVHFYIRTPDSFKNLIESAIYSQYPDAEVVDATDNDYMELMPRTLPNKVYDIFGIDYHLIKPDAYPIQTYEHFEDAQKEKRLDPIAALTEAMSKLKNDEAIWIQIFVSPTGTEWKDEGEAIKDKMLGRDKDKKTNFIDKLFEFIKNLAIAPAEHPAWAEEEKKKDKTNAILGMTPGERSTIEAMEEKMHRLGFETNIRFIYIDKRANFTRSNIAAVMASFHQFNTLDLNGFRPNVDTMTIIRGNVKAFKTRRLWYKKRRMWESYRRLYWPRRTSVLNVEELATLYHFPSIVVEAPSLRRLGAKKGEPPPGLPIQ